MASRRRMGGFGITLPSPFKFTKKASWFNQCVGQRLRGARHPGVGRARVGNSKAAAFTAATRECRAQRAG